MLLNGHQLNCIIAGMNNPGQDVVFKLFKTPNAFILLRHPDMCFINEQAIDVRVRFFVFPNIGPGRQPYLGIEDPGNRILDDPSGICRNPVTESAGPVDSQTVKCLMVQRDFWQSDFPHTFSVYRLKTVFRPLLPACHLADYKNSVRIGSPFSENPFVFFKMQSEKFMAGSKIRQGYFIFSQPRFHVHDFLKPSGDDFPVRFQ